MKLVARTAPYIRKHASVSRMMLDVIIALMPVTAFAMYANRWNAIYVLLISIGVMLSIELISHMFIKWPTDMKVKELFTKEGFKKVKDTYTINNILAPLISAIIYAMILPAGCSWYVVLVGAIFGILIGKMVFGGLGSNIFNPAAIGRVFVAIAFGSKLNEAYPTQAAYDVAIGATPLGVVKSGTLASVNQFSLVDMFLGNIPGSMGEVSALCILIGGIYLFARRSADLRAALSYLLSFAAIMFVAVLSFNLKHNEGDIFRLWAYQCLAGGVFFAGVFMITDPVTSPITKFGRICYGALAGAITVLIRVSGAYPEGAAFSIIIANTFTPLFDYLMRGKPNTYTWKQCLILGSSVVVIMAIVSASVVGGWF